MLSVPSTLTRTWRGFGLTSLLVLLAGCSTPRDANTPSPAASPPVSRIEARPQSEAPSGVATYTAEAYATALSSVTALPAELQQAWQASKLPEHALSLVVAEVGQQPSIAINPFQARNPASVMKLVTTYAALEGLGPGHTWRTELLTAADSLPRADGSLPGPLYVRAAGDPQLSVEDVWRMLRELRLRGIRSLPGVIVDRSVFGNVSIDPGAFDNTPDRVYNASPDALVVGFGAVRLQSVPEPATGTWRTYMDPPLPGVRLDNQIKAGNGRCPGPPAVRTRQTTGTDAIALQLSGTVALSCGPFSLHRLILAQPDHAAHIFQQMWTELGGQMNGPISSGVVPPDAVVLAAHESRPLSDMIRTINKLSNNVMARMVLLALGEAYGTGPATPASGAQAVTRVLADEGLVFPELVLENGSGLSRHEAISASSLASMLNTAWASPRMPEFLSSMAIAGEDGTVRRRLQSNGARGRAHLKTGTLRDASALAGYVQGVSGRRYILVSMVNDSQAHNAKTFNDRLVAWLAAR